MQFAGVSILVGIEINEFQYCNFQLDLHLDFGMSNSSFSLSKGSFGLGFVYELMVDGKKVLFYGIAIHVR